MGRKIIGSEFPLSECHSLMMAKFKYYGAKTDNRSNDTDKITYSPFVKYVSFSIVIKCKFTCLYHTTHVQKLITRVSSTIWTRRTMRVKLFGGKSAGFYSCSKKKSPMIIDTSNLRIADTSISET